MLVIFDKVLSLFLFFLINHILVSVVANICAVVVVNGVIGALVDTGVGIHRQQTCMLYYH